MMAKQKNLGVEGSYGSQMIQLIRQYGYNKDMSIDVGVVVTPPPKLTVRLTNDDIVLEEADLIVADNLLDHELTATISGGKVDGKVEVPSVSGSCPDGTATIPAHSGKLTSLTATDVTIKVKSPLQTGTPVIVIGDNDTDLYYLVGMAVV